MIRITDGLRVVLAAVGQDVEAVAVGQADVGQHQVERLAARSAAQRPSRRPVAVSTLVALLAQPVGHRFEHVAVVVDQEQVAAISSVRT